MHYGDILILAIALSCYEARAQDLIRLHPAEDRAPAWSPDGSRLLIESDRDGNRSIYVDDVEQYPAWSSDGRSILFFSRRDTNGERDELYVMDWKSREVEARALRQKGPTRAGHDLTALAVDTHEVDDRQEVKAGGGEASAHQRHDKLATLNDGSTAQSARKLAIGSIRAARRAGT